MCGSLVHKPYSESFQEFPGALLQMWLNSNAFLRVVHPLCLPACRHLSRSVLSPRVNRDSKGAICKECTASTHEMIPPDIKETRFQWFQWNVKRENWFHWQQQCSQNVYIMLSYCVLILCFASWAAILHSIFHFDCSTSFGCNPTYTTMKPLFSCLWDDK